jgi:aminoglycoside/choline kinase family phosphotransferase
MSSLEKSAEATAGSRLSDDLDPALVRVLAARGFVLAAVEDLAGDVSARRYRRLRSVDHATLILAAYPESLRDSCRRFLKTTELLGRVGVRVPRVVASDSANGWTVLEDLGDSTLAEHSSRPWQELSVYFRSAVAVIGRIASTAAASVQGLSPALHYALMTRELRQTWTVYLAPRGLLAETSVGARLNVAMAEVCSRLAREKPVACHRDFMARNLMPLDNGEVGVLDHQDLRLGPPMYDLASLLNDTLFPPPDLERQLLAAACLDDASHVSYHRSAAQRTLKAVGTYAAFAQRGSSRHLPLIAPTLQRFVEHLGAVPEGASLAPELRGCWAAELNGDSISRPVS